MTRVRRAGPPTLAEWISKSVFASKEHAIRYLVMMTDLAGEHVSRTTISAVSRGLLLTDVRKAMAVSRATGGAVPLKKLVKQ